MKPPYCEIHGLVCGDVVSSVSVEGADIKESNQSAPGRRTATISDTGRNPRKIKVDARFLREEDLDQFISHVNSAPEDCEIYPFRDDRCCYAKRSHARVSNSEVATIDGETTTFHRAKALFHVAEPWMYGIEKGVRYASPQALPATVSLKHEGTVEQLQALDKLCARGQYVYGDGYVEDLTLTFTPEGGSALNVILCTKMMANDLFEVDRYVNVKHSYENNFDCDISALQADLHGSNYIAYCTLANGTMVISGVGSRCIMSFYGPLPISEVLPYIDLDVVSIGAYAPKLVVGSLSDLSDLTEIADVELHVGKNRISIPGREGTGDLFVGFIERECWIAGPDLITARGYTVGGGTDEAAICIGGRGGSPFITDLASTEEFNGTAWSAGGNLATARHMASGGGDPTGAISMGGGSTPLINTEEYNGTSWSSGGNLGLARKGAGGSGNASAAFICGGYYSSSFPYYSWTTERYNGTVWAAKGDFLEGAVTGNAVSSSNGASGLSMGGYSSYVLASAEYFDGLSWHHLTSAPTVSRSKAAAAGDEFNTLLMGGDTYHAVGTTEAWDNVSWSTKGDMITARYGLAGGLGVNGICMGGVIPTGVNLGANNSAKTEIFGVYSSIELRSMKAVVSRYIDPELLPVVDPGDTFELKIDSGGAEELAYLELYFRDAWWF